MLRPVKGFKVVDLGEFIGLRITRSQGEKQPYDCEFPDLEIPIEPGIAREIGRALIEAADKTPTHKVG